MRLFIFYLLLPSICFSQSSIDAEQFFDLGRSQFEQTEKPELEPLYFPWINQYELRTESRDFDLASQEYTFRLSPSTGKIRKAQKAYYEQMKNAPDFEGQENYCDLLLSLHVDWLALFILQEQKNVKDELVAILDDQQTIYERMVGTLEFDPQKLIKLQTDRSDSKIGINKLVLKQAALLNKYNLQNQDIDFVGFATIESISKNLERATLYSINPVELMDLKTEHKKQLLLKEIELESAEKKQLIDFAQIKYTGPHSDALQERLSVGLGFQISNAGSDKLKMQKLQLEKEELNRKSEWDVQEKKEKLNMLEYGLRQDIQAYFDFQDIREEERGQLQNLGEKIAQKEGVSPLFLLEIAERNLSMKDKSLNKKEDLFKSYLKYLQQSGDMCQSDFINYLKV